MQRHALGPDCGDFASLHVRRRPARHHANYLAIGITVTCGLFCGFIVIWAMLDHSAQTTAAAPTVPSPASVAMTRPTPDVARDGANSRRSARGRRGPFGVSGALVEGGSRRDSRATSRMDDSLDVPNFGTVDTDSRLAATTSAASSNNPFASQRAVEASGQGIDALVLARLGELGIQPARLCTDEVFLRRVYVDVLGTLPTVDEARRFLDDTDPGKRARLVDQVLERPEFADYAAMRWADVLRVKAEFPIKLWPNAAHAYHHWIRHAMSTNMPYDEFARQLLTASGSNFRAPQVNFYRALQSKEPKGIAAAVALTFLGERAEQWPTERLDGMSRFFIQVGYKPTGEWKEEIVYFDRRKGMTKPNEPFLATLPNGERVEIARGVDPRRVFADWLIQDDNPWFARVAANRIWHWLLGRGIVDPPDDIRRTNPASNLPLLNHLSAELVAAKYDLRHLYRLILNSQTYQMACLPADEAAASSAQAAEHFASYPVRRLDAEVLIDAICQITGTYEVYSSIIPEPYTFLPDGQRAVCLPDGSISSPFLEMFGRPARDTGLESERSRHLSAAQALHLLNSNHLRNKLKQGQGLQKLLDTANGADETADLLYLAILSRRPTDEERGTVVGMCGYEGGARDVAWALINSDEFLYRH